MFKEENEQAAGMYPDSGMHDAGVGVSYSRSR